MRVAAIIPTFNNLIDLRIIINELNRERSIVNIYIINNGDEFSEKFDNSKVFHSNENLGWLKAINFGLKEAYKDETITHFLVINDDVRLSPKFVSGLLETDNEVPGSLIGPVYNDTNVYQVLLNQVPARDYTPRMTTKEVPFLDGVCLFFSRNFFDEVGLLNEEDFEGYAWGADYELSYRARQKGRKIITTELSYLTHKRASTAKRHDNKYTQIAGQEADTTLKKLYGNEWQRRLSDEYLYLENQYQTLPKVNVLFLYDKNKFSTRHSQSRLHYMKALEESCNVYYWGFGFDDFINDSELEKRILNKFKKIDFVFAYRPKSFIGLKNLSIPIVLEYNEMINRAVREESAYDEIKETNPSIVFCRLRNEMINFSKYFPQTKFVINLHCHNRNIFSAQHHNKDIDIGLVGDLNKDIYPFRERLRKILDEMKTLGYNTEYRFFKKSDPSDPETHLVNLANYIASCKICVTCTTVMKERIAKLVEIPACGTLLACDTPDDYEEEIFPDRIRLETYMSDQEIIYQLKKHLDDNDLLSKLYLDSIEWSSDRSMDRYAKKITRYLHQYQQLKLIENITTFRTN